jgi:hypothetical protein
MDGNYEKPKVVPCSEILNSGPRLSAFEDFMQRTMSVLQGVWSKLNYIRELRESGSTYEHWGLAQLHGKRAAGEVIGDIHSELYLQLLRTPLPDLLEQLKMSAEDCDCSPSQLAEKLDQQREKITPKDLRGGAPEHLESVLITTRFLAKNSKPRGSACERE